MVRKHLSVRSETSPDVRPLVSIAGRTSTLILPRNKRRAYEKPTCHRSTTLWPPRTPAPPALDRPRTALIPPQGFRHPSLEHRQRLHWSQG